MNPYTPKVTKKRKQVQSLETLLDQIERLKADIERVQVGYKLYRQMRSQLLGKHFLEWRTLLLQQLQALDHLHQHPDASKAIQRDISHEFKRVFHHFDDNFTWTSDEIRNWNRIVLYHTGLGIEVEDSPVVYDTEGQSDLDDSSTVSEAKSSAEEKKSIKGIYKDLMKYYHPDRNSDPNSVQIAQEITVSFQEGDLDRLLKVYKQTFQTVDELDGQELLRKKMEQELELLLLQYDEMIKQLGVDQNMTEKSAKKRVKAEVNQIKNYLIYQRELLQVVYCDIDIFKQYIKQR